MPVTVHYADVVETLPSMAGKVVCITGCTSGTGLVLARTAALLGARVVMINRPSRRADDALALVKLLASSVPIALDCDLCSFSSVRTAAATLRQQLADVGCDVLCNNAGVMGLPDVATIDGFDVQMQSNHLSHFLLTHELWPLLRKAAALRGEARVVNHTSGARRGPPLARKYLEARGGQLGGDGFPGLHKWRRYQQSKLANLLFTYALHARAGDKGHGRIKALAAHPGPTDSGLQAKTAAAGGTRWLDRLILRRALAAAQSVEDGAAGITRCSCEADVESGSFIGPTGNGRGGPAVVLAPERDAAGEALLWSASLAATGINQFFTDPAIPML